MLRAVIFDFDGVITDSEVLHFRTFNEILGQYDFGITMSDYYKNYLGLSDFDLFGLLINEGLIKADASEINNMVMRKNELFEEMAKTEGKIIEGVRDFLGLLKDNNIPLAICSGALLVEIEMILEDAGLRSRFETVVSAEQVRKGKPDTDGFLLALKRLNKTRKDAIAPEQCIVIEDSHWGLEAAKSAGMHTLAVTNSYDAEQLSVAEKTIDHLGKLKMNDLQELCS